MPVEPVCGGGHPGLAGPPVRRPSAFAARISGSPVGSSTRKRSSGVQAAIVMLAIGGQVIQPDVAVVFDALVIGPGKIASSMQPRTVLGVLCRLTRIPADRLSRPGQWRYPVGSWAACARWK